MSLNPTVKDLLYYISRYTCALFKTYMKKLENLCLSYHLWFWHFRSLIILRILSDQPLWVLQHNYWYYLPWYYWHCFWFEFKISEYFSVYNSYSSKTRIYCINCITDVISLIIGSSTNNYWWLCRGWWKLNFNWHSKYNPHSV